ncbi:MAG: hypothetical protein K5860_00215, partial [Bacteroidales bacterium]|nr:hypothetical protein [Bacteroidales bacterium]
NYRKNEETQHCIEVQGNISSNVEYETFPQWPLLIIEEPKDSNNADPLSLKYYKVIVQIPDVKKKYCIFGYKRKLKKQKIHNTSELSISIPVVNKHFVSSYYRYMVDTDVTNQEGLNGLFQVRPFEEYTRYYNSSAEVQSWLTGRLCFYKDTVVACGIALDYGGERITFFSVELKDKFEVQNLITGKLEKKDKQEKQSIYQYFCKAGEILVTEFQIQEKNYEKDHLYVVSCVPQKNSEINIVSFTLMKFEYEKILEKKQCDSSLIYDYELYFREMEKQNDNKGNGYYQMKISICRDRHVVFADKIEMLYGCENISPMIFQSEQAGYSESVLNGSVDYAINQGNICFQKNDEEAYVGIETSDCKRGSIKDECDCEEEELKTALKDIKIYTPNIYNVILRMLYIGVPINYPDGHKEMFRPQILIKYSQLENNFIGTCTPVSYKKLESGLDSTSGLSCEFNNNITNYVNQCKKSILINDNKIKCINVESWNFNDFSIKVERYNNELKYKDAISKGYGLIEPSFRIELDLKERCKAQCLNECLKTNNGDIPIKDFNRRRYHNASVLIHEFGHVYERITNMYNDYIWNLFESYLKSYQKEHPINDSDYRNNQNTLGHIMGRPSGVCAVKWELEFTKNFFLKNHEKVFTEIENKFLSGYEKYIKYKPIKQYTGIYNIEFYRNRFCETYKYNINDENNIFLQ